MTFTIIKKQRIVPRWKIPFYWLIGRAWWDITIYEDCKVVKYWMGNDGTIRTELKAKDGAVIDAEIH